MKLRISWWWLVFLPLMLMAHMGKTLCFLFAVLSIHEGAHILMARLFHYPIKAVIVYPFGLCAHIDHIGMGSVGKELMIIAAGPLVHLIVPFCLTLLVSLGWISDAYGNYLNDLNHSILIFNLLPIFPLDGGRILQSFYHLLFRYTLAQRFTYMSSILHLLALLYYRVIETYSAWLVMAFLLFQILMCWHQLVYERMAFYHYRKMHPAKGPLRSNHKPDLFRAYTNMMYTAHGWILEDAWLNTQTPMQHSVKCHFLL